MHIMVELNSWFAITQWTRRRRHPLFNWPGDSWKMRLLLRTGPSNDRRFVVLPDATPLLLTRE
jgi:hypothetical protein